MNNIIRKAKQNHSLIHLNQKLDIDECETRTANCGPDEICRNKPGGYTCSCPIGHTLNAQRRCEDINECEFYRGQVNWHHASTILHRDGVLRIFFLSHSITVSRSARAILTARIRSVRIGANARRVSSDTEMTKRHALTSTNVLRLRDFVHSVASTIGARIAVRAKLATI